MPENTSDVAVREFEQGRTVAESMDSRIQPELGDSRMITPIEAAWMLWNNRRRIFRSCVIGVIVFACIAFLIPKRYKATARLMPPDYNSSSLMALAMPMLGQGSTAGSGAMGGSVMNLAGQLLGMNSSSNLFIGVLRSRTVEDSIIQKFNLQSVYSQRYLEDTRETLESRTDLETDKKTGILRITVEDKNPTRAAAMVQAYVDELGRVLTLASTSSAHRERLFIEKRLNEVKQDLDNSSREFSVFASQNSAINLPEQAKAMVTTAAQLQGQLIVAESELKTLEELYTDSNIRVRQARARVSALQEQVNKFGGKGVDPNRDSSLSQSELYPSVRQLPLLGVRYLDLFRKNKIDETIYELLTKQYEVVKIQEARENPTVQLLDKPVVPEKKSFPHRLPIMLAGLFLSFLGISSIILGESIWERVDPQDPRRLLGETVLASIKTTVWDKQWSRKLRSRVSVHRGPDASQGQ